MASGSSTSPTSSSSSPSPSSNGGQNNPQSSQGNLYLFTFLATLLVLLLISCSIVFRSFVLRRRYQRRLQEALASGGVLAPRTQGSHRKRFRTRPKFFDVWLSEGGEIWEDIMPVSACHIKPKRRSNPNAQSGTSQSQSASNRSQVQSTRLHLTSFTRGLFSLSRSASASRLNTTELEPSTPSTPTSPNTPFTPFTPLTPSDEKSEPLGCTATTTSLFQVSVLIAMPSPGRHSTSPPSEEIPDVCFGVTRLPCKIPTLIEQGA
ncbi:hypothetical protein K435DRAFT_773976 [Dendrothele bispora CBS 962.96]|uniref:Uncharacterized protein n=1 Tax=Dendrothele bispora (strain CBS 962.96) TaxID=1314807 RepID=A0A4S8MQE6_DENBC|nr:hypothetical protein K435DRAFT_773976 [Dendrothele bispora CBS 962.96]